MKFTEKEKTLFILFGPFDVFDCPELGMLKNVVWNTEAARKIEKPRIVLRLVRERLKKRYLCLQLFNLRI